MRPPCKGCPDRAAECKKTCDAWIEYETEYLEAYAEKQKTYENSSNYWAHLVDQIERNKKKVKH